MIVDEQPIRFSWAKVISLSEFPELLALFQRNMPSGSKLTTADIEHRGRQLVECDFRETDLQSFIKAVCNWGGYPGIAGRVLKDNPPVQLSSVFRKAHRQAQTGQVTDVVEALKTIQQTKNLGGVSFASKHLKFLVPDSAVVLDSIIGERLAYPMTSEGYRSFLADCHVILQHIVTTRLEYTGWATNGWRVSDVEMAIFAKLKFAITPTSPSLSI